MKARDFKIPDQLTAWFARYFEHHHPEHRGIFEMREIRNDKYKDEFRAYLIKYPQVYQIFCEEVLGAIALGEQKLSSKTILGYIRWEVLRRNLRDKRA